MSLKENLKKIKEIIKNNYLQENDDLEFEADLENHSLGTQKIYRLYYINYHRIGGNYGNGYNNVGVIDYPFDLFTLPEGMSREDAFKVLSYLTDYIEKEFNIKPCSLKSVMTLNSILDIQRLGFKKLNKNIEVLDKDIIDLFTVTGRLLCFKESKQYNKYFEWYTENITLEEVKSIYHNCGIEFYDLEIINNNDEIKCEQEQDIILKKMI